MKLLPLWETLSRSAHQQMVLRLENHLKQKYQSLSLMLTYYDEKKYHVPTISIDSIIIKSPKEGIGTKVMGDICGFADTHGYTLILNPSGALGGNRERLIDFYKRFGFDFYSGNNIPNFSHIMVRTKQA